MTLYETVFKRKSTRKFDMTGLSEIELSEIKDYADNLKPLFNDIKVVYEIGSHVKNIMPIKAPHYFILSSETKDGYLENIGFMFQQMDLFLQSKGYGACWLGMARPTEKMDTKLEFVIILAFGKGLERTYRELSEFKRKDMSEISSGDDSRMEAARLAPSATNSQHWFFVCENEKIHCYQKKLNPLQALMYDKMNKVDMGIAMCHLYVASEFFDKTFAFEKTANQSLKGYTYTGTI